MIDIAVRCLSDRRYWSFETWCCKICFNWRYKQYFDILRATMTTATNMSHRLPPWKGPFYRPKPDPWFIWSTCREEHKIWQAFILIHGRINETTVTWVDSCKTSQRWYFEPIKCKWFNLRILIRYHLIVVDRDERDRKQWMVLRLMYVE